MSDPIHVGFIGIGDQGAPMAAAIAGRFPLHVWARREASYEALGDCVFTKHANPLDLAAAVDLLCVCLRSDADLHQLLGSGVLDSLRDGAILMNHATGDPDEAMAIAALCATRNVGYVDAPVSGGRPGALSRSLTCFVGTSQATLDKSCGVLATHSRNIVHMGQAGTGQAAKLCNNALTVSNLRNIVEVFSLANAFGLDATSLQKAFARSSGGSFILDALGTKVTPEIAAHIAKLNRVDVEEFANAGRKRGLHVEALEAWAFGGADGLEGVVARLTEKPSAQPERLRAPQGDGNADG